MKPTVFLLHFAGGNRYSYQFLKPYLENFSVVSLELPGRGGRLREGLIDDLELASLDIVDQVLNHGELTEFIIYGHSMGANLALKTVEILSTYKKSLNAIVVSGSPGPGISVNKKRYLLSKQAFKMELMSIGGVPDEFWADEELYDFFEPILRADFKIAENADHIIFKCVSCPIYVIMGDQEELSQYIDN